MIPTPVRSVSAVGRERLRRPRGRRQRPDRVRGRLRRQPDRQPRELPRRRARCGSGAPRATPRSTSPTRQGTLVRPSDRLRRGELDLDGRRPVQAGGGQGAPLRQAPPRRPGPDRGPRAPGAGAGRLRPGRPRRVPRRRSAATTPSGPSGWPTRSSGASTPTPGTASRPARPARTTIPAPAVRAGHALRGPISWRHPGGATGVDEPLSPGIPNGSRRTVGGGPCHRGLGLRL